MLTNTNTAMILGEYGDIEIFAKRIKSMMRGGEKLSINDAMSLAQFAKVTNLNPFIGECWWIPGSGAMVGIAGARRLDQERAVEKDGYSFPVVTACNPEEAGATEAEMKDVAAAFKVEINDSAATKEQNLRELGFSDEEKHSEIGMGNVEKDFPPESKALPRAMTYDDAKQTIIKVNGKELFMGQLSKEQLDTVIEKAVLPANVEAAKIVLKQDYGMEPQQESLL